MSAIARYFNHTGIKVSGYDIAETALTKKLVSEGIEIHYEENVNAIPKNIDTVIFTPAIPKNHTELVWLKNQGFELFKRAQVLGWICNELSCIAIAGTHGKTSTSAVLSYILKSCGVEPYVFLGGLSNNYNTNFLLGDGLVIAEADEFDRSFLQLHPEYAVITSMDADHLDIYGTKENMNAAFEQFTKQIKDGGFLFIKSGLEDNFSQSWREDLSEKSITILTYGSKDADAFVECHVQNRWNSKAEVLIRGKHLNLDWNIPGAHNLENVSVALLVAQILEVDMVCAVKNLEEYTGVKRRFEKVFEHENGVVIDDYAHHPEELEAAIGTVRAMYPTNNITGIFQPHLYSRTKDHYFGFAQALSKLDTCFVLPIYPAREEPIEGVDAQMIVNEMKIDNAFAVSHEDLRTKLNDINNKEIIITLGAGNLSRHHNMIIELIT